MDIERSPDGVSSCHGVAVDCPSVNDPTAEVLGAASDPDPAGSEAERVRERLARAGVLASAPPARDRPDRELLTRARAAAGRGTPLTDLVGDDRA